MLRVSEPAGEPNKGIQDSQCHGVENRFRIILLAPLGISLHSTFRRLPLGAGSILGV